MTFPTIAVQGDSTDNTADTSGTINLPVGTYTSGQPILAFSAGRDNVTFSSPSTGWTEFIDTNSPSNDGATGGWWKESDGTESGGTMTFTTSSATKHPGHVIHLNGAADPSVDPPEATQSGGATSGSPNPPSHTASWTSGEDNFFIAVWGQKAPSTVSAYSSTPASPTDTWTNNTTGGGGACGIHGGCYYDTARDTVDPGAMTMTGSNDWSAATISVRPAAAAGGAIEAAINLALSTSPTLTASGELAAAVTAALSQVANLTGRGELEAAISVALSVAADLRGRGDIESVINVLLTASATLQARGDLSATAAAAFTVAAQLAAEGRLEAAAALTLSVSAFIRDSAGGALAASIAANATVTAALQATGALQAAPSLAMTVSAILGGSGALASSEALTLAVTADLRDATSMAASIQLQVAVAAQLVNATPVDLPDGMADPTSRKKRYFVANRLNMFAEDVRTFLARQERLAARVVEEQPDRGSLEQLTAELVETAELRNELVPLINVLQQAQIDAGEAPMTREELVVQLRPSLIRLMEIVREEQDIIAIATALLTQPELLH